MGTPLSLCRVIKARTYGQGFVAHPHTNKLVTGRQVPADLITVHDSVSVVVAIAREARVCHALIVLD